jgi:hypothetical protein
MRSFTNYSMIVLSLLFNEEEDRAEKEDEDSAEKPEKKGFFRKKK